MPKKRQRARKQRGCLVAKPKAEQAVFDFPYDVKHLIAQYATNAFETPLGDFDISVYTVPNQTSEYAERQKELEDFTSVEFPSAIALRLCLVSKDWYEATHKFMFFQVTLRDPTFPIRGRGGSDVFSPTSDDVNAKGRRWLALAKRLSQPPHSRLFGDNVVQGILAGHLVRRLCVYSRNFSDTHQRAIVDAVIACPNIFTLIIGGPISFPYLFRLSHKSTLIQGLQGLFSLRPMPIQLVSLTLPLDPLAVPTVLKVLSYLPQMETLVVRQDTSLGDDYIRKPGWLYLHALKNFVLDGTYGGDMRYFDYITDTHTPQLSSLMLTGRGELEGLEELLVEKVSTLKTIVADYYGFDEVGMPSMPVSDVLETIVVTYHHGHRLMENTYASCKFVGLSGPKMTRMNWGQLTMDFEELREVFETLLDATNFPALSEIQLMDISNEDLLEHPWQIIESEAWTDIMVRFRDTYVDEETGATRQVRLVDSQSEPLVEKGFEEAMSPVVHINTTHYYDDDSELELTEFDFDFDVEGGAEDDGSATPELDPVLMEEIFGPFDDEEL